MSMLVGWRLILLWLLPMLNIEAKDARNNNGIQENHVQISELTAVQLLMAVSKDKKWIQESTLLWAAKHGKTEIVKFAVNASTSRRDDKTPLHYAAMLGHNDVVRILIESGANIKARDKDNYSPFQVAFMNKNKEAADLIETAISKTEYYSEARKLPIFKAIAEKDLDEVKALVASNPLYLSLNYNSNIRTNGEYSPLFKALEWHETMDIAKFLIEQGANVNIRTYNLNTPLHMAVEYGKRIDVIKLLFGYGADINAKNELGETPLHKALVGGWEDGCNLDIVRFLVQSGADVNVQDYQINGNTPLKIAYKECRSAVPLLVEAGARPISSRGANNYDYDYYNSYNNQTYDDKYNPSSNRSYYDSGNDNSTYDNYDPYKNQTYYESEDGGNYGYDYKPYNNQTYYEPRYGNDTYTDYNRTYGSAYGDNNGYNNNTNYNNQLYNATEFEYLFD